MKIITIMVLALIHLWAIDPKVVQKLGNTTHKATHFFFEDDGAFYLITQAKPHRIHRHQGTHFMPILEGKSFKTISISPDQITFGQAQAEDAKDAKALANKRFRPSHYLFSVGQSPTYFYLTKASDTNRVYVLDQGRWQAIDFGSVKPSIGTGTLHIPSASNQSKTLACDFKKPLEAFSNGALSNASNWPSQGAVIEPSQNQYLLKTTSQDTEQALEAWQLYKRLDYTTSWSFEAKIHIPKYWSSNQASNAQVGMGLFAGQFVKDGVSAKVFESNFAVISDDMHFVQGQIVPDRLGGDPSHVDFEELPKTTTSVKVGLRFCANDQTIGLWVDDKPVGQTHKVGKGGIDDWDFGAGAKVDIGVMGFAENTTISSNYPSIQDLVLKIY